MAFRVKCSYCNKPLDRHVFCRNSHRVMFFLNKKKAQEKEAIRLITQALKVKPHAQA